MLLDLSVWELEHLQAVRESGLSGLGFSEVIHDFLVWIGLFDVVVVEVDYSVAIREHFSLDSVAEDDFLLPIIINSLDFTIMTNWLLDDFEVLSSLVVVFLGEFHFKVLIFFLERLLLLKVALVLFWLALLILLLGLLFMWQSYLLLLDRSFLWNILMLDTLH